jgi:light-regulated signal transduction histidine kinase (bacteriophytochrome)
MQIKDIVNHDIVNLTNCEQEPIHIPGSIQPHGFLLAITIPDFTIEFCSGNTTVYLGMEPGNLLGQSFKDIFGETATAVLQGFGMQAEAQVISFQLAGQTFDCTLHYNGSFLILEGEPGFTKQDLTDVYGQTKLFLQYMEDTRSLTELCQLVAEGTRNITGYDRVMIYRFDEEYNGEVIDESCREELEPFLGLHYPHTDIPPQARLLYIRNLLRVIVDVNYTPIPIYTIDNAPDKNLDLGIAVLRSTSPIHVQYLQNMGVGATLTISLLHKGRLWGLIACHHYSAKNLSHEQRVAAKLQGHFITSQIDTRQLNEEYDVAKKCNEALEKTVGEHYEINEGSFEKIAANPQLLEICNASGVAILCNGQIYKGGTTPSDAEIHTLSTTFFDRSENSFYTDHLAAHMEGAREFCEQAAGIIFHNVGFEDHDCIMWFRPQTLVEVNWAGDPAKAIIKNEHGLSPRNSFKLWKEIVQCKSKEWLQPELTAAANYAHSLEKLINLLHISEEEQKYRNLSALLKDANAELENLNWISTHDLQEPLRKIQIMASRILSPDEQQDAVKVQEKITKISQAANRMQRLLKDILQYTRIRNANEDVHLTDPAALIEEIMPDLDEVLARTGGSIKVGPLPTLNGSPFLIKQLFSNLFLNSLKFQNPGVPPAIQVSAAAAPVTLETDKGPGLFQDITVADNGIGFKQEFADSIFNVFTRLHNQAQYEGSGIGLALCKKIMQAHKGHITASGQPGIGATFHLYFPVD